MFLFRTAPASSSRWAVWRGGGRYAGFSSRRALWTALLLSGRPGRPGVGGEAAALGQLTPHVPAGYGFAAIIVAFVGRLHPVGMCARRHPDEHVLHRRRAGAVAPGPAKSLTGVFQGLLLFALLACDTLIHYRIRHAPGGGRLMEADALAADRRHAERRHRAGIAGWAC